jgi:hypothetical protein
MRLDEIRRVIQGSTVDAWHVLSDDAPTYVHGFEYSRDNITGVREHHSRAVLWSDVDIGLAWGMDVSHGDPPPEPDWTASFLNRKAQLNLVEVLYRGQPVDRVVYAGIDNAAGKVPWPESRYAAGANLDLSEAPQPPEALEVTAWQMGLVTLIEALGGGGPYRSAADYTKACGITVLGS